jgi:glycerol-3-phosphate O-acyltransferase
LREYLSKRPGCSPQEIRQSLALELVQAINSVTPLTPLSLLATAILSNHRRGFFSSELLATVKTLMTFLKRQGIPITSSLSDIEKATGDTLSLLIKWRILESIQDEEPGEEPFFYLDEEKKVQLEYYKNSIIHYLIGHAFVAISLLTGREDENDEDALVAEYDFLEDLFRNEFVFDQEKDSRGKILESMGFFLEEGYVSWSGPGNVYRITKLGYEKLPIWAALAKTFVESYWIAVKSAGLKKAEERKPEDGVKHAMTLGRRLYKSGAVDHIGALSPLNFQNALAVIHKELHGRQSGPGGESQGHERLAKIGQKLYAMAHYGRA